MEVLVPSKVECSVKSGDFFEVNNFCLIERYLFLNHIFTNLYLKPRVTAKAQLIDHALLLLAKYSQGLNKY